MNEQTTDLEEKSCEFYIYITERTALFRVGICECKAADGFGGDILERRHARAPRPLKRAVIFVYPASNPENKWKN